MNDRHPFKGSLPATSHLVVLAYPSATPNSTGGFSRWLRPPVLFFQESHMTREQLEALLVEVDMQRAVEAELWDSGIKLRLDVASIKND